VFSDLLINGSSVKNGSITGMAENGVDLGSQSEVTNMRARDNGAVGIGVYNGSIVSGNTVYNNVKGIVASAGSTVSGNTAYKNTIYGIQASWGCTVSGNTAMSIGVTGIFADRGSTIQGNSIRSNDSFGMSLCYGISVNERCHRRPWNSFDGSHLSGRPGTSKPEIDRHAQERGRKTEQRLSRLSYGHEPGGPERGHDEYDGHNGKTGYPNPVRPFADPQHDQRKDSDGRRHAECETDVAEEFRKSAQPDDYNGGDGLKRDRGRRGLVRSTQEFWEESVFGHLRVDSRSCHHHRPYRSKECETDDE
jgi:parallel beta-helix repeat protein